MNNHLTVEPSDADALHAELVAAFFHPPRIVVCGFEASLDDEVIIVSHVELWPWRTVVRGSLTHPGSIGYDDRTAGPGEMMRRLEWFHEWSLTDDVGTSYHQVEAGRGGDGFCSDVNVAFQPAVPSEATLLTIAVPGYQDIEVAL
ncbi:MAG: hypothetical protein CL424_18540 [Acidimicrobiaceae bacterium]|nr:hypothetical protein [Acidimicrobiaceae bacterium]